MQVILLQDVAKIGRRHAVVEVPDGFARNRLIPLKQAIPATKENLTRVANHKAHAEETKKQEAAALRTALAAHAAVPLQIAVEANAKGHLFKAVTKEMVAVAAAAAGAPVPVEAVVLKTPIKAVGEYVIMISHAGVEGECMVVVVAK